MIIFPSSVHGSGCYIYEARHEADIKEVLSTASIVDAVDGSEVIDAWSEGALYPATCKRGFIAYLCPKLLKKKSTSTSYLLVWYFVSN